MSVCVEGRDEEALASAVGQLHSLLQQFRNRTGRRFDVMLAGAKEYDYVKTLEKETDNRDYINVASRVISFKPFGNRKFHALSFFAASIHPLRSRRYHPPNTGLRSGTYYKRSFAISRGS